MVQTGQDPIPDMNNDIDGLFIERICEVVADEISTALDLKTAAGRRDRLQRIVNALERVDRPDDGPVDDAIMEAEDSVYRVLYKDVDWSKEPPSELSISEDMMMGALKEAITDELREKGLSDKQIKVLLKKTFKK